VETIIRAGHPGLYDEPHQIAAMEIRSFSGVRELHRCLYHGYGAASTRAWTEVRNA
jgi:hypothetical protein